MVTLASEIRKANPFDSPQQEAFLNLLRTADFVVRDVEHVLKPAGLSSNQYNVLRILRGAGAELACGEIADRMIAREPDLTRLLDRIEKRGLISRTRDTKDRRIVRIRITQPGLDLIASLDEPVRAMHAGQFAQLTSEQLQQLITLLEAARQRNRP